MPSSTRLGSRPRIRTIEEYSAVERLCSATSSGVIVMGALSREYTRTSGSAAVPDRETEETHPGVELFGSHRRVFLREEPAVGGFEDGEELHVLEHLGVAARGIIGEGLDESRLRDRGVRAVLLCGVVVGEQHDGLDVGIAVADELEREILSKGGEGDVRPDFVLAHERAEHVFDLFGGLRVEERDFLIQSAAAV